MAAGLEVIEGQDQHDQPNKRATRLAEASSSITASIWAGKSKPQEALLTLARERGFETITVHDIARQAAVNRATFYLHFEDKYDLLTQTMREVIEAAAREYAQLFESDAALTPDRPPELLVRMLA